MEMREKLSINKSECINCGICVRTCPAKIFLKYDNYVEIDTAKENYCINCGDCISVCPKEAIKNENVLTEEISEECINLQPEQLVNFFRLRRSVRNYKPCNLSEDEKKYLTKIASLVPKGGHTQSIRNVGVIIVESKELIEEITDYTYEYMYALKKKLLSVWIKVPKAFNSSFRDNINDTVNRIDLILDAKEKNINMLTYNSANIILLHCEKNSPVSAENLTIMEYQLMLGAETLNLGTCFLGWVSFAMQSYKIRKLNQFNKLYNVLGIPKDREVLGVFAIGQKNAKYRKLKGRSNATITTV